MRSRCNPAALAVLSLAALSTALPGAYADDFNGYLTVNDEDYGYWEARISIFPGGVATPLDEHHAPIDEPLVFEIGHDLARGLVRQYSSPPATATGGGAVSASGAASGGREVEPPTGNGQWVLLLDFATFGFGQYEGSATTASIYCDDAPRVWAWLSGPKVDGEDPNDTANRLILVGDDLARLKLACGKGLEVAHE